MSASVTQLRSSWTSELTAALGSFDFTGFPAARPLPGCEGAFAPFSAATPCLSPRRAGTAIATDILPECPAFYRVATAKLPFTAPKPISPAPADLHGARVLVVDDE